MPDIDIQFGGTVKAKGNGKFEAPLITFTSPTDTDLTGDFFNKDTDLWDEFPKEVPLLYSHGQDDTLKTKRLGVKGKAKLTLTDAGVWMEGQLNLADAYEAAVYKMIEAGKMGTSSGSVAHLVEREAVEVGGQTVYHIKSWPIAEGSLTPTPAEPKNRVMPLKSLEVLPFKSFFRPDWNSEDAMERIWGGVGREMTAQGIRTLFDRVMMACYDCMDTESTSGMEVTDETMPAVIDKFAELAKGYIASVRAMAGAEKQTALDTWKGVFGASLRPASVRDIETRLRDAFGLSRSEAKAIASDLSKSLLRDAGSDIKPVSLRDAETTGSDDVMQALLNESLLLDSKTLALQTMARAGAN